jgi:hypothetical protein
MQSAAKIFENRKGHHQDCGWKFWEICGAALKLISEIFL